MQRSSWAWVVIAAVHAVGCAAPTERSRARGRLELHDVDGERGAAATPAGEALTPERAADTYGAALDDENDDDDDDDAAPSGEAVLSEIALGGVADGHDVLEGDIAVEPSQLDDATIASATGAVKLWPGGVVPYVVDASLTNRAVLSAAIQHWRALTGIRLVPRTTQSDHVRFVQGTTCWSYIGRIGGRQDAAIGFCSFGTVVHEIGHAIGLFHEQSRSDRDAYVTVHTANILPKELDNYRRTTFTSLGSYDFSSIMHYGSYAFSANGKPTVTRRSGAAIAANRLALSAGDTTGVRRLYAAEKLPSPAPGAIPLTVVAPTRLYTTSAATAYYGTPVPQGAVVQGFGKQVGDHVNVGFEDRRGWVPAAAVAP
jgi:hypothetical protein